MTSADARNAQEKKDEVSKTIVERFIALPEYAAANTVMWYLDVRSEVRTRHQLADALNGGKRIIVPYCTVDESGANKLGLWHLTSMDELVVGKWKILEPPKERWGEAGKEVEPRDLDLVMVPGVGFARDGARMGNGQGYYDRLLKTGAAGRALDRAGLRVSDVSGAGGRPPGHLHGQGGHRKGSLRRSRANAAMSRAHVEDTYAEAFKSLYAEVLITARDRTWLDHAVNAATAATGNGSSTILCDCEAGLDRYVGPGGDESFATPDGRPGAIIQLHVPRFR